MFIKTTFNSDLNHILNCVNKCDFGTKCFAKVEHFVLRLIDIIGLNPDNMDSIGNMKVQIKDIWFSNEYMNVRFMLNFPNPQRPILNLVVNEMIPLVNDGYAHLELRYNNNGSQGRLVPGLVSFKLGSYSPENSELKGLKVLVRPVGGEEKTYIFSYPLTDKSTPDFNLLDLAELK